MSELIKEAFQELKMINEDTFSFDKEGVLDLSKFLTLDDKVSTINVIDPNASNEEELEPNYDGKVILRCCVCNQDIYANPAEVIVDDETQRVNVGEECPHCYNIGGYKVIGQVQPFVDDEIRATVDGEEVEIEEKEEFTESLETSPKIGEREEVKTVYNIDDRAYDLYVIVLQNLDEEKGYDAYYELEKYIKDKKFDNDILYDLGASFAWDGRLEQEMEKRYVLNEDTIKQKGKWVNKGKEGTHGAFRTKKAADAQRKAMFAQGYRGESLKEEYFNDYLKVTVKEEDINHFDEETGDIIINSSLFEGKDLKEGDYIKIHFDDEGVGVEDQEFKFIRKTEDGHQFEWLGVETEKEIGEALEDKDAYALTGEPAAKYNYLIGKDIEEAEADLKDNGFRSNGYKDISNDQTEWYYAGWDDSVILTTQGEDAIVMDAYYREPRNESFNEDFTKATVETGESVLSMESDDSGKVTVTSEPRKIEESGEEMIAPLSDEVEAEIKSNSEEGEEEIEIEGEVEEPVDVEVEEIEEEGFDELGESYLTKVYDNVKSFKTIKGSINENKIKLEGIITFNSGKKAKTSFIFESAEISKRGKVKFLGENAQLARKKNAFTLQGTIKDHKLMVESLTYNYRAQDSKTNTSIRTYGTVKRK